MQLTQVTRSSLTELSSVLCPQFCKVPLPPVPCPDLDSAQTLLVPFPPSRVPSPFGGQARRILTSRSIPGGQQQPGWQVCLVPHEVLSLA